MNLLSGLAVDCIAMIGRTYEFETELDLQIVGTYRYHAIKIPVGTQAEIEFGKGVKPRFEGRLNGVSFSGALLPTGTGRYYAMVNEKLRRRLGLQLGCLVQVSITLVDPNIVNVPDDLMSVLESDQELLFKWEVLTAGTKRGILHQIESARTEQTRLSRISNLLDRRRESQPFEPFSMRVRL
jgi:hypothetical protein